ncbi:hypothetical protein [Roseateles sp. LYH14W]|uniref:Uncharacterized protein n=1 Tax=Pelomonas parva TaxID=3299032 RepID=A0ABW7FCL7_9BURK
MSSTLARPLPRPAPAVGGALIAPLAMAQITVRIDVAKPGLPVSPTLYGLMTEEINFPTMAACMRN